MAATDNVNLFCWNTKAAMDTVYFFKKQPGNRCPVAADQG